MSYSISVKKYDPPVSMLHWLAVVRFSKEIVYSFDTNLLVLAFPNSEWQWTHHSLSLTLCSIANTLFLDKTTITSKLLVIIITVSLYNHWYYTKLAKMHAAPSLAALQSHSHFAIIVPLAHPFIYLKRKEAKPLGLCSAAWLPEGQLEWVLSLSRSSGRHGCFHKQEEPRPT